MDSLKAPVLKRKTEIYAFEFAIENRFVSVEACIINGVLSGVFRVNTMVSNTNISVSEADWNKIKTFVKNWTDANNS